MTDRTSTPPSQVRTPPRPLLMVCLSGEWSRHEAAALAAAEALRARGAHCTIAVRAGGAVEAEARGRGFDCLALETRGWLISPAATWALRQWLRERADAAVFCPRLRDVFVVRPALLFRSGVRLVASAIFESELESRRSAFGRWIFGRVDALIAHSVVQRAELLRCVAVPSARMPLLAPSIDLTRFSPERRSEDARASWHLAEGELAIGAVGHEPRARSVAKGEPTDGGLLQALAILIRNKPRLKWRLVVAADPSEPTANAATAAWAKEATARLGLERVTVVGAQTSLPEFCASVDLFVSTAPAGAFDSRLFEAMASGTPTFATASGVVAELVKDARASLLWRTGNPWDLARQIERAILDPHLRARVGSEGRSLARARHEASAYEKELFRHVQGMGWLPPVEQPLAQPDPEEARDLGAPARGAAGVPLPAIQPTGLLPAPPPI